MSQMLHQRPPWSRSTQRRSRWSRYRQEAAASALPRQRKPAQGQAEVGENYLRIAIPRPGEPRRKSPVFRTLDYAFTFDRGCDIKQRAADFSAAGPEAAKRKEIRTGRLTTAFECFRSERKSANGTL